MKDICNNCDTELAIAPTDSSVRDFVCLNTGCASYGLLVAYPKPQERVNDLAATDGEVK